MKKLNLSFLKNITDEDKFLLNQVADWVTAAENKYIKKYSFFLDECQSMFCEQVLKSLKFNNYKLYGGCERANRKILSVYSEYCIVNDDDFPIRCLLFKYNSKYTLSHRDFLGSLMSLNIARNTVGDIVVSKGCAQIYVYNTIYELVLQSISKIGRVGVTVQENNIEPIEADVKFEEISGTASSLRLDCILSLSLHISREKSKSIIMTKGVIINHIITYSVDTVLNMGDIFSVKGFGKYILKSINGVSKKNRFHITLNKYV
ncbi:MAG: RNA-binding protein [Ruminococcus sp.]|nr:RNA-binding protein [Ruminococcus sp.]